MIDSNKSKNMFFKGQWLTMSIIMVTLSAFLMLGSTGSADPETVVDVPDFEVDVVFSHWGTESYWDTTISGIGDQEEGYNVWDDTWVGWCVDEYHYIYPGTHYDVTLYSSYDSGMPWPDSNWDMVNYVINHKHPDATKQDVQDAIWSFINGEKGYPSDPEAQAMVDEAIAYGEGFVPQPVPLEGQKCAVLCDAGDNVQRTFIEVLVSPDIVYVDDDFDDTTPGWGYDHFDNIMDGVIAVADCGTVYVAAGTYIEQVIIDKSLELLGDPGATIMAPDIRNTYTIDESSNTFDPIIFAYGGTLTGDHVSGTQTISVKIDGFEIDGGNKASTSPRFVAILYRNIQSGCTLNQISNNVIHSMYDADGEGNGPQTIGIFVYGDSEVTIETNDISEFSRLGIGAIGNNGPNDPVVVIEYNTVTGNGLESGTNWWAENGIQISVGAGGDIIENIVSDCQVNNPSWVSSGILVDDAANGVNILENDVTLCDTGISIRSPSFDIIDGNSVNYCNWDALRLGWPTDNATVTNNILTDSLWGIYNADASDNLMEYNLIQNNVYGIGIDGDSHNNLVLHNDILDNDEYGVYLETYYATPSGNEIHYNNIAGNGLSGVENIDLPHNVDAICNWWGHCSGPTHATTNPLGCGDAVSDNVDYLPWLDAIYPLGSCIGGLCQDPVYVDDDFGCSTPGWNVDHFATIQTAIDRLCDGGTVYVAAGIYEELIVIDRPMSVLGATHGICKKGYTIPSGYAWDDTVESIIQAPNPFLNGIVVDIDGTDDVTFDGFVVQSLYSTGTGGSGKDPHLIRVNAHNIYVDNICVVNNVIGPNTHVTLQDGTLGRMNLYLACPSYSNGGITHSEFSCNKIFGAEGNGNNVFVWGSAENYNPLTRSDFTGTVIENNEICDGHRSGIELAGSVDHLTIRDNDIYGHSGLTGDDPTKLKYGNGILSIRMGSDKTSPTAQGALDLTIENNHIYNNEKNGIYLGPINSEIEITENEIHDNGWDGISIDMTEAYYGGYPVYNQLFDIIAVCNEIYDNGGFGAQVIGTPTNGFVFEATCNWWGDCSGPPGEGPGSGDAVSTNVDFDPWVGKITVDAGGPYHVESWEPVEFDGTYTTGGCCGETLVSIVWNFGDGETSTDEDPTHIYAAEEAVFHAIFTVTTETIIGSQTFICVESDEALVYIGDDDPPIVQLEYPRGGEDLSGTINIQWFALDSEDQGSPSIWLYYTADGGSSWVRIAKNLENTIGDGFHKDRGEYSWSAGSLPDGNYMLRIHAYDTAGNLAIDTSDPFAINNHNSGLLVSYVTVSSNYVKNDDSLEIKAGITQGTHLTAEEITADLSGFGKGTSVPADSFDGLTATWDLTNVICTPSDGPITITVTAGDESNTATITADNTLPELTVIKPENALYFFNAKLFALNKPIIIGAITLEATADDSSGVQKTEIYIDDELKETLTGGSEWYMNLRLMGRHTLKIVAYDNAGNINEYTQTVMIYNLFGDK
jgi:parallel beta-helix repeat protein